MPSARVAPLATVIPASAGLTAPLFVSTTLAAATFRPPVKVLFDDRVTTPAAPGATDRARPEAPSEITPLSASAPLFWTPIVASAVSVIGPVQALLGPVADSSPKGANPVPPIDRGLATETPPSRTIPPVGETLAAAAGAPRAVLVSSIRRPEATFVGPLNVLLPESRHAPPPASVIPAPAGPETTAETTRSAVCAAT